MTTTPTKPFYTSKTFWATIITVALAVYDMLRPRYDLPQVPPEMYAILLAFGLYGVRTATTTIGGTAPTAPVVSEEPNNVVPAGLATAAETYPVPGGDGSPLNNVYPTQAGEAVGVGFLGAGLPAIASNVLASPLLEGVIKGMLRAVGLPTSAEMVLKVALKLGPDLLDGNPQLSETNLAVINNAVIDVLEAHK